MLNEIEKTEIVNKSTLSIMEPLGDTTDNHRYSTSGAYAKVEVTDDNSQLLRFRYDRPTTLKDEDYSISLWTKIMHNHLSEAYDAPIISLYKLVII